jgi:hypothetical protein
MERDVRRMVNQDRNVFASLLVALGHGDAMISGMTRTFAQTIKEVRQVLDPKPGHLPFGIHMMVAKNDTAFLADTTVNERPNAAELAHIATETPPSPAAWATNRAWRSCPTPPSATRTAAALDEIRARGRHPRGEQKPNFEYEGEMRTRCCAQSEGDGELSVQPPLGFGRCADHARPAIGQHLRQAAARTCWQRGDRPDDDRHGKARPDCRR